MNEHISRYAKFILYGILIIAALFRFNAVNWDQGFHLHPDERAIVLAVVALEYPQSPGEFLNAESPWNPKFFAYGSFPFYLLKIAGDTAGFLLNESFARYEGINLVGRVLSAFFDLGTIIILFALTKRISNNMVGLIAAFFYAISVLPIQLSHFYAVDTILTFFMLATVYLCVRLERERTSKLAVATGGLFGLALATKVSAILLVFPLCVALFYMLVNRTFGHHMHTLSTTLKHVAFFSTIILLTSTVAFVLSAPYALIDQTRFIKDTLTQSEMTKDAFVFPYTLQYALKIPYLHETANIFFFGLGPIIAVFSLAGFMYYLYTTIREKKLHAQAQQLIILSIVIVYFLTVGGFKVGFMRYMLPLYPFFCLLAATIVIFIGKKLYKSMHPKLFLLCSLLFALLLLVWPVSFMAIYAAPNTRVQATDWIHKNIRAGDTIAIEHWDDGLPLTFQHNYVVLTLPMYDSDTDEKWQSINNMLATTDYIIIASNRLYTPLMRLTDCNKLPEGRCYRRTAEYYQRLFSQTGQFKKVAEFSQYPTVPILNIPINDYSADESFTVYDHPKVMIFQKK